MKRVGIQIGRPDRCETTCGGNEDGPGSGPSCSSTEVS